MGARIGLTDDRTSLTPNELIAAILRAPVDLLWNGGIGTYVKAKEERHAEVGDRANDAVRVDAEERFLSALAGEADPEKKRKIIGNEFVGSSDLYYFVPADSPVKSFKDLEGKTVAVARLGSSSESAAKRRIARLFAGSLDSRISSKLWVASTTRPPSSSGVKPWSCW